MKPPLTQQQALAMALKPYRHYSNWIKSKDCFLSREEIGLISLYLQTGSYHICCGLLQKGIIEVADLLLKTILRLNTWAFLYQRWEQEQSHLDKLRSRHIQQIKRRLRQHTRPQRPLPDIPP